MNVGRLTSGLEVQYGAVHFHSACERKESLRPRAQRMTWGPVFLISPAQGERTGQATGFLVHLHFLICSELAGGQGRRI